MNTEQFRKTIDELHDRMVALTASKGEEYKRREDNQFANFERGARALGLTREQVLLVYASKHFDSIVTYVKDHARGEVREYAEPITGRIDDLILYMLLFRGMVEDAEPAGDENFALDLPDGVEELRKAAASMGVQLDDTPRMPVISDGHVFDGDDYCTRCGVAAGNLDLPQVCAPQRLHQPSDGAAGPKPDLVISPQWDIAVRACLHHELTPGVHALSTVDQLFGIAPDKTVCFIATGNPERDGPMLGELQTRAERGKFRLTESYAFADTKVEHQQA